MDNPFITERIVDPGRRLAREVAAIHKECISKGFLSTLPMAFLTCLYQYIARHHILITVCKKEDSKVAGYISATTFSKGLLSDFLKRCFIRASIALAPAMFRAGFFSNIRQTAKAAGDDDIAPGMPELLSVAVVEGYRSTGAAASLLSLLEQELLNAGINQYKVVAGKKLHAANRFYLKNGFIAEGEKVIHDNEISVVYTKRLSDGA